MCVASLPRNLTPEHVRETPDVQGVYTLWDGAEWQQMTLSSVDSQFQQLRLFQLQEIARAFNIPASPSRRTAPRLPTRAPPCRGWWRISSACAAARRPATWWTFRRGTEVMDILEVHVISQD